MITDLKSSTEALKVSKSSSSSSFPVILEALSNPITGKFGEFRVIQYEGKKFNVDSRKITNPAFFTPNCPATISFVEGKDKENKDRIFIDTVVIPLPAGVMSQYR